MKKYLNFDYKFSYEFKPTYYKSKPRSGLISVDLPHYFYKEDLIYKDKYTPLMATYMKDFAYKLKNGEKVFLNVLGACFKFTIYLNNKLVGTFNSMLSNIRVDITSFLKDNNYLVFAFEYDSNLLKSFKNTNSITTLGIFKGVYLENYEKIYVDNIDVSSDDRGNIKIKSNIITKENSLRVYYQIYDHEKLLKETNSSSFAVKDIKKYNGDNPYLYDLKMTIKNNNVSETIVKKIGFKSTSLSNRGFYLNDKKIKMMGLNFVFYNPSLKEMNTYSSLREDLLLIKKTGVNFIKVSYALVYEKFFKICDELGILVMVVLPELMNIKENKNLNNEYCQMIKNLIFISKSHVSLLGYYVEDLNYNLHSLILENDKNHYIFFKATYHNNRKNNIILVSNLKEYFKKYNLLKILKIYKCPVLVINDDNFYSYQNYDSNKKEYIFKIYDLINKLNKDKHVIGYILNDAFDYKNENIISNNGVYDKYRNIKDIFYIYSSILNKKADICKIGDFYSEKSIEVLTNVDYISLYKNNVEINTFYRNRRKYRYVNKAYIEINDLIGKSFNEETINKKYYSFIVSYLNDLIKNRNNLKVKIKWFKIHFICKLNNKMIKELLNKYQSISIDDVYEIKGYKDNMEVVSRSYSFTDKRKYEISIFKTNLINDKTYDSSSIHIRLVDANKNLLDNEFYPINIKTMGPIQLYSENLISLIGGQATIYFKSLLTKKDNEEAKIFITDANNRKISLDVNVKNSK